MPLCKSSTLSLMRVIFSPIITTFFTKIGRKCYPMNLWAVFNLSQTASYGCDQNWAKFGPLLFVILEILNAIDRPIVHWLSKTSALPNKGRPTEERELCAGRCGEGPSLFFSPFVFFLAYEDTFLHIISPSEYTFTLSIPLSLWTFFCANHIQCTTYQLEETFQDCDFSSTDMWDLWPHL